MKYLLIVSSLIVLFSITCTTSTEPETRDFVNTLWHLESIKISNNEFIIPPEDHIYTIKFRPDSTFLGDNGCNDIGGEYHLLSNSIIAISRMGTTYQGCSDASIYKEYYSALNNLRHYEAKYEIKYNRLYINYRSQSGIRFIAR